MIKITYLFFLIGVLLACKNSNHEITQEKEKINQPEMKDIVKILVAIADIKEKNKTSFCYINEKGDTLHKIGPFEQVFTDTLKHFAIVYDKEKYGNELVAINKKAEVLFEVYNYDNGPDYLQEGLFRIKKKGKIGYADTLGNIVIKPQFACAEPFENNKAKVSYTCKTIKSKDEHQQVESKDWFYISRKGERLK